MTDLPPYDPAARITRLRDLDKLRAVEDRELAELMARVWVAITDPRPVRRGQVRQLRFQWKECA
jgi:hypothetical protein